MNKYLVIIEFKAVVYEAETHTEILHFDASNSEEARALAIKEMVNNWGAHSLAEAKQITIVEVSSMVAITDLASVIEEAKALEEAKMAKEQRARDEKELDRLAEILGRRVV